MESVFDGDIDFSVSSMVDNSAVVGDIDQFGGSAGTNYGFLRFDVGLQATF